MPRSISVLHLDGVPDAGRLLADALGAEGLTARVDVASGLPAFAAALESAPPDIAVCSFASARGASRTVRQARVAAPQVPVVAMLGTEDPSAELDVLVAGAVDCLSPSRAGRLGLVLRRAIAQRDESARREVVQTEINSLEAQLHHAERLTNVARLATGVAHDFNNLLTIINGCSQFLLRTLPEGHELRPLVEPIEQAGARGAELTRRILSFSRQEPVSATLLNLNDVITGAQPILAPLLGETTRLALNLDPSLWLVHADPGEMGQVLMNLAANARDAMPDGGTISVRTGNVDYFSGSGGAATGSYVELVVRDAGCGMTEAVRARIFDPFFTTKAAGHGTGLGLATVQRIVTQHGGEIDVETAPGRGTSVRVRLPRAERTEMVAPAPRRDEPSAPAGNETVLVVEDETAVRAVVCGFLRGVGYRVLEAADADVAGEICNAEGAVDLLISDVVLPGLSGPKLAVRLKELQPSLKTLFISGYPADALTGTGMERAASFLPKPFSREVLLQRVRKALAGEQI